jgi:RNA polymerase sigma-70 factor, ECF subfamily
VPRGRERDTGFEDFYMAGFASVFKSILVTRADRDLAEEATQEGFARALERWERLRDKPWALAWVITTAMNLVRRDLRRRTTRASESVGGENDPDTPIDLWRAIRSLPQRQQEAVALYYIADLPLEHVARAMGCQTGTVKAHLWRARRQLARNLEVREDA